MKNNTPKWVVILLVVIVAILLFPFFYIAGVMGFVNAGVGVSNPEIDFLLGIILIAIIIWTWRQYSKKQLTYKSALIIGLAASIIGMVFGIIALRNFGFLYLIVIALTWAGRTLLDK